MRVIFNMETCISVIINHVDYMLIYKEPNRLESLKPI